MNDILHKWTVLGMTVSEISEECNMTVQQVMAVLRKEWVAL